MVRIAFDWSVNTLHTGFLIAREFFYEEELGRKEPIEFIFPDEHTEHTAPKLLERDEVDYCLMSPDDLIYWNSSSTRPQFVALASITHFDCSEIAVKSTSGIKSPKELDGCSYGSYGGHYEVDFVRELVKADGGKGEFKEIVRPKGPTVWDCFIEGKCDVVSIYSVWEKLISKGTYGVELTTFSFNDYYVPYFGGPLLVTKANTLIDADKREKVRKFMRATTRGYMKMGTMPVQEQSALLYHFNPDILLKCPHQTQAQPILQDCLRQTVKTVLAANGLWGQMRHSDFEDIISFMNSKGRTKRLRCV